MCTYTTLYSYIYALTILGIVACTYTHIYIYIYILICLSALNIYIYVTRVHIHIYIYICGDVHACTYIYIYDAGLPHPRSPPHPMVSPLACQVGSCLVWPCYVPRLVLIGLVPSPPLWSGACGLFGWPRPACGGQCVLQRYGMVAAAC